jgi:hypothetical protein
VPRASQSIAVDLDAVPERLVGLFSGRIDAKPVCQGSFGGDLGLRKSGNLFGDQRSASAAAFGAPDANSISRAEMTPCASQVNRTASSQLSQKSAMSIPRSPRLDIPQAGIAGARSEDHRWNYLKLTRAIP